MNLKGSFEKRAVFETSPAVEEFSIQPWSIEPTSAEAKASARQPVTGEIY